MSKLTLYEKMILVYDVALNKETILTIFSPLNRYRLECIHSNTHFIILLIQMLLPLIMSNRNYCK